MCLTSKDICYAPGVGPYEDSLRGATGEGSYAKVYEGRLALEDELWLRPVAIKQLKFVDGSDEADYRNKVRV